MSAHEMVAWYRGVLDQIEQEARACGDEVGWEHIGDLYKDGSLAEMDSYPSYPWGSDLAELAFMARHDPAAVLRDVEAKRRIIELHEAMRAGVDAAAGTVLAGAARIRLGGYGNVLRLLAGVYADWPGYRQEWSP